MMSALSDASQRTKKKLATYSKPSSKPRSQTSTPSITGSSEPSRTASQTPTADIYDYDFIDDVPPPVKSVSKPRPLSTARPGGKKVAGTTLSASPMAASAIPKPAPSVQRNSTIHGTGEAARGLKRKPSQAEAAIGHRTGASAGVTPASRNTGTTQVKKVLRESPSPDPIITASSPPLLMQNRAVGKVVDSNPSLLSNSLLRQRAPKTPPRDTASLKSPVGFRSPSASPRKQHPLVASTAAKGTRKPHQEKEPSQMPLRPLDNQLLDVSRATVRQPLQRTLPATRTVPITQQPAQRKRRRLIDTLAAQVEDGSSSDEGGKPQKGTTAEDDEATSEADTILSRHLNMHSTPVSEGRGGFMDLDSIATASPEKTSLAPSTPATITRRAPTRRPGVKFTYNLERTMLAEEPVVLGGPQGSDLSLLESLLPEPEPKPAAFDFDDDMGGPSQGAIQSIHELRQAGANSRFADELVDIMDRVGGPTAGKPSSARRSALLEMVQKLQEKSFLRHFRDQGAEMRLFFDIGKESDILAGYAIVCIVVTLLASGSASHSLLREFRQQRIKDLFAALLDIDSDIVTLSKDRKSNVSHHMRQHLVSLKETMKKLPVWKPAPAAPSQLSPRTLTLKALHMFAQQLQAMSKVVGGLDEDDGALSPTLTKALFGVISSALPSPYDDDSSTPSSPLLSSGVSSDAKSVDLFLVLSLLETHSVSAMQSDISAEWTRHYLPIVASALEASLEQHQKSSRRLNNLELLILKLALNTANNNPDAARYYVDRGLLRRLADLSSVALTAIARSAKSGEDFTSDALNELLLMLGVMINFSENDMAAGETLAQGGGLAVFDQLGKTFLDGRAIAAEADSEEKSQLNVAFAYLSILLGYLCLHDPIYEAFRKLSPSGNLEPLLESIRQFIILHDQIGKADNTEQGAEASHFTARLRALAHELEARA